MHARVHADKRRGLADFAQFLVRRRGHFQVSSRVSAQSICRRANHSIWLICVLFCVSDLIDRSAWCSRLAIRENETIKGVNQCSFRQNLQHQKNRSQESDIRDVFTVFYPHELIIARQCLSHPQKLWHRETKWWFSLRTVSSLNEVAGQLRALDLPAIYVFIHHRKKQNAGVNRPIAISNKAVYCHGSRTVYSDCQGACHGDEKMLHWRRMWLHSLSFQEYDDYMSRLTWSSTWMCSNSAKDYPVAAI